MTKNDKIILYGSVALLSVGYIIYNNSKKTLLYEDILKRIGGGSVDFNGLSVWDRTFLLKLDASKKPYAKYTQDVISEKAKELNDAINYIYSPIGGSLSTDENAIYSIFDFFDSKVGINQLATFYSAKYNVSLRDVLMDELSESEQNKLALIINQKFNVIYI